MTPIPGRGEVEVGVRELLKMVGQRCDLRVQFDNDRDR